MPFIFEENIRDATLLLQNVAAELQTEDLNKAGRIFRAVLQSIRDRLPVHDAIQFAAQLPTLWKGIYFDQYEPHKVPVTIRDSNDWINYIRSKNAFAADNDFQQDEEISASFQAVFRVLQRTMPEDHLLKVKESLKEHLQELLPA
ncbi:DUF2267 domain-containing protein [Pontibacter indicus]|uniref:Uncharacterized conserved protein, DUF2267 family n=1 Tax=Pontibacter indicus TaxID=1317125 RepID=A0A1R3XRX4_9BACT|nr:DUF2267 domain-containing protein [Pontibacter indicus]SIT94639.1 Uncharacterized conserved protein, DUF2267 family [Pontibacter indicus]